jgi:hypothetical protein
LLVLLSSAHSPRYREDILRCLAAPVGSEVQFRYDKQWIVEDLLEKVTPHLASGGVVGAVCYIDLDGEGVLTMIPVRAVEVTRIHMHGRSVSLVLKMGGIHYADPTIFTKETFAASGSLSPQKHGVNISGKYFFEVSTMPSSLKTGFTVGDWEKAVTLLRDQPAFKDEPFYWTTIGILQEGGAIDSNRLGVWPEQPLTREFDVLIYHYLPKPSPRIDSKLSVTGGGALEPSGPAEVDIDSRYDLKRWRFLPKPNSYGSRETWLRIRTADRWNLDLRIRIKGPFGATLIKAVVAGTLIAIPTVVSAMTQKDITVTAKLWVAAVSLVAGVLAACAVVFSIEKLA